MNILDNMIKYNEEKEEEATDIKNKELNNKNNFQEENKEKKEEISFNNNLPGLNDIITNNKKNENNIYENNNNDNIKEDNNTKEHNIENENNYNYNNYNNQNLIYQDNNINFIANENNNIYGTNLISNINNINYNNNMNNINNYMSNNINNNQNQNIENNIPQQKGEEKDIIDELIEKIRTNQQITNRESSKESLNRLDEEIKLGLERLNELFPSQNTYFDTKDKDNNNNKNKIGKMKVKNRKFTDLLHEINKILNDTNNKTYYKRNHYYDYKNMKIMKPRIYFQSESRLPIYGKLQNSHNNLYMSSIDGKLIVNGERKNLFSSSNLENIYKNTGNNFYPMKTSINFNNNYNFNNLNRRRNYSIDKINSNFEYKKRNPSYNIRSANRFNKDYFKDELYKIQNMLFRDNRRSNKYY